MHKPTTLAASIDLRAMQRLTNWLLLTLGMYILLSNPALATALPPPVTNGGGGGGGADSPMGAVLCNVVGMIMGDIGRGLATLAVIVVGIGATLGKVSWGMAMTVAVGIAVVFGAPSIVYALGVQGGGCAGGSMINSGGWYAGAGGINPACYAGGSGNATNTMLAIQCGAQTAGAVTGAITGIVNAFQGMR